MLIGLRFLASNSRLSHFISQGIRSSKRPLVHAWMIRLWDKDANGFSQEKHWVRLAVFLSNLSSIDPLWSYPFGTVLDYYLDETFKYDVRYDWLPCESILIINEKKLGWRWFSQPSLVCFQGAIDFGLK